MFLSDDDMVECPYNKTHRMLRKRLQSHLLKCRLNYPDVELRKCPFNITHLIPEPEFTHHATNCPDRKLITQYKYDAPEPKEEEGPKHAPIECDEDWDDTDVNDYNPKLYLENANIIRKPVGANPSERKLFIKQERKRLGDADDNSDEDETKNDGDDKAQAAAYYWEIGAEKHKRSTTSSTSSHSKGRSRSPTNKYNGKRPHSPKNNYNRGNSRSPTNKYNRERSRSPQGFGRSQRNLSPSRRRSPEYARHNSPPQNSFGRSRYSHNSDKDSYNRGSSANNPGYSGSAPYYSNDNQSQAYYDCKTTTKSTMPEAPPAPMISYPAPRSYLTTKYPSQDSSN